MNVSSHIEWLQRQWALPDAAVESVRTLLHEEESGSTACVLKGKSPAWGRATGGPDDSTPLVIVEHDGIRYLQSRRFYSAERKIAARIISLAGSESVLPGAAAQVPLLFPGADPSSPQPSAATLAMSRQLAMITGGPGTGKTYTLARILALCVAAGLKPHQIRLAAPTGKASERMKKAVADSLTGLPADFHEHSAALTRIADSSATLHKLLGHNPSTGDSRYDASHPLACRVLILDECSMIDVLLWQAVLDALPDDARLILLGDPNQLESVGQGNVFAELTRAALSSKSPLDVAHVQLTEARRFRDRPDILAFARAIEESDAEAAVALLEKNAAPSAPRGLAWLENPAAVFPCEAFPASVLDALGHVARAATPAEALDALSKICILTPQRNFFVGSRAMSAAIDAHFLQQEGVRNQPVIIEHNDPETGLRNGTLGVIHTGDDGRRKAWFPGGGGGLREVSVAKLPEFSPAWAITIHRSQGSEFDEVLVILPREDSPMATRALLYTAITRAKKTVCVAGDLATVKKATVTRSARCTTLASFLA